MKLRRALLAALAKQQILSVSDGGEQALVAYDPQTALGEMVFTGLASEVQYLQQCISDLEACNQRSRRELSGNRAMEEALVPFDRNREETTTARALVLDVQVLRQRLDELDRVNRRLYEQLLDYRDRDEYAVTQSQFDGEYLKLKDGWLNWLWFS